MWGAFSAPMVSTCKRGQPIFRNGCHCIPHCTPHTSSLVPQMHPALHLPCTMIASPNTPKSTQHWTPNTSPCTPINPQMPPKWQPHAPPKYPQGCTAMQPPSAPNIVSRSTIINPQMPQDGSPHASPRPCPDGGRRGPPPTTPQNPPIRGGFLGDLGDLPVLRVISPFQPH